MGEKFAVTCKSCGERMCVNVGSGRYLPTREDVEDGDWCESLKEALPLHPDWIPAYIYQPYLCSCGYMTGRRKEILRGPDGEISTVDNVCSDCGRKMRHVSVDHLNALIHAPENFCILCRKCGGSLEITTEILWD